MKRTVRNLLIVGILAGGLVAYYYYDQLFSPVLFDPLQNTDLKIRTGSTFEDVVFQLQQNKQLKRVNGFKWLSRKMGYSDKSVKPGRYVLTPGMNNISLVRLLRSGNQTPVKVVIYEGRTPDEILRKTEDDIETDTRSMLDTLYSEHFLQTIGLTRDHAMCIFIPNTYEVYWNISPRNFLLRMKQESDRFWSRNNRKSLASKKGLSPEEAYTLASIVEKETNHGPEKPTIAGVYLNRLKNGIRLQADPTVVFAKKAFTQQRVLHADLSFESPYNTYLHDGLPPGPISIASIESIDAVLNAENHDYLFFCAKPGYTGQHAFAATHAQHSRNARLFHEWMNQQDIR
ncbi:MAG TPA: endolytic transglycosylase MltG [Saprospiraceae bacterium]|nr:endolytic transglycosylase MltG [Saprospiraceae bacterium]HNT19766.1 endolytic transglycosylase MltG [Saprospiraceae bacterium]